VGSSGKVEDGTAEAPSTSRLRKKRQRLLIGAGGVVFSIIGLAIACIAYTANTDGQLLRADPDALPNQATLVRFAMAEAAPIYTRNCAACHGANLKGNSELGAPNLADQDWIYGQGRIAEIEQTITYGIRSHNPKSRNLADMPGFARAKPDERVTMNPLSPPQIDDLVSHLFAIEGRGPKSLAAARGEALFLGSGGCFDCHGSDAKGDSYVGAVNLADNVWLYGSGSASSVFRSIAKGHAGVCPAWVNKIRPAAIRALAVYIYVHSHSAKPKSTGGTS
jgi:cbb3-type cytochrome c oxidase subunit III